MEKKIAIIRYKMIAVISIILALGAWQHDFIMQGIAAHMEMTLTILGTFAFSVVLAFVFVSKLKNEVIAFQALREMWDDIQAERAEAASDPLWKHARCRQPAKVFYRPRLLGHAYELVTDEVARTKKIRVSVETMNTLVSTIEQSIHDEKSMIVYMSGLLVFMGLIGTFIGLLHMVGAIGGIIGSLAQSAGGAGATGAFQELLGALQEPLKGMASGFASSLFGLFSSLVVGLLGRFAGQAAGVLKREFEAWLAGLVKISDDEEVDTKALLAAPGAVNDPALVRMVGGILADYGRLAGTFERMAQSLAHVQARQEEQAHATSNLALEVAAFCQGQSAVIQDLKAARIGPTLREAADRLCDVGAGVDTRVESQMRALREVVEESVRSQAAGLRHLAAQQAAASEQIAGAIEQLAAGVERASATSSHADLVSALERNLSMIGPVIGRALSTHFDEHSARMNAFESAQQRMLEAVQTMAHSGHKAAGDVALEQALDRLNDTVATAFTAYSSILQVSLTALERSGGRNGAEDAAPNAGPLHGAA